jgi:hypothetical protein
MKNIITITVFIMFTVTGCSFQRANLASRAQKELVGMKKIDLLSCAGVPHRQQQLDDLEFFTYTGGGDSVNVGVARATSHSTAIVTGKSKRRYCEATFILKDGIVQEVNYQGRTGGLLTKGEQCAFIIENCLNP